MTGGAVSGRAPSTQVTGRSLRLAFPVTATILAVLALILLAAGLVLSALVGQLSVLGDGPHSRRRSSTLSMGTPFPA